MSTYLPVCRARLSCVAVGLLLAGLSAGSASATSCMVMGDTRAVVKTSEGLRSPMFLAKSCESLKLVSGRAMASWVSQDGKPHLQPITAKGPAATPSPGAEERSSRAVWAELSSRREVQSPAVMRGASARQPDRAYVPQDGLTMAIPAGAEVKVTLQGEPEQTTLPALRVGADGLVTLTRQQLPANTRVLVAWTLPAGARSASPDEDAADSGLLWLQTLPQAEQAELDAARQHIRQQVRDPLQQTTLDSMLFEQRQLSVNLRQSLATLTDMAAANGRTLPRP